MDLSKKHKMMDNWRGRRYLACNSIADLHQIIGSLGVEDGSELPPADSQALAINPAMVAEMQNMATNLLRMIMLYNDGNVSPSKLNRF